MYMPSQKLDIPQSIINSDIKPLSEWLSSVNDLILLNSPDTVLYCKNIDSEIEIKFLISQKSDILMNIEQNFIDDNCSMTLKQWKECLNSLSRKFGEDSYLYLTNDSSTFFYLSPMI